MLVAGRVGCVFLPARLTASASYCLFTDIFKEMCRLFKEMGDRPMQAVEAEAEAEAEAVHRHGVVSEACAK